MPAKKTTAKTTAKKQAAPTEAKPTTLEGFATVDYEGHELFVCDQCGADTFSTHVAREHLAQHNAAEVAAQQREALTENLAEHAQVTTEVEDGEG